MGRFLNFTSLIYLLITICWLGEFLFFQGNKKKNEGIGRKTFYNILKIILFNISLSIVLVLLNVGNINGNALSIIQYLSLAVYLAGLLIRYYSIFLLGHSFNRTVVIDREDKLVSEGLYSSLRHPLYLGLLLLVTGGVAYMGNLLAIIVTIVSMFTVINARIKEEEDYMEKTMGNKYIQWKKKRYRLIPFIY